MVTQAASALGALGIRSAQKLEAFASLDIHTPDDVLLHLPSGWEDRTAITPLGEASLGQKVQVEGEVRRVGLGRGRRRMLLITLEDDGGGKVTLMFFHFSRAQQARLRQGDRLRCFGTLGADARGQLRMVHPEYRHVEPGAASSELPGALLGVYPKAQGLTQWDLRRVVAKALQLLEEQAAPADPLCELAADPAACAALESPRGRGSGLLQAEEGLADLRGALDLARAMGFADALRLVHRPPADPAEERGAEQALSRLALDELVANYLARRSSRRRARDRGAIPMGQGVDLVARFLDALPFAPTAAQRRVVGEIQADMASAAPMLRLLQGDVGSGKSAVAAAACLQAVGSGCQAALLAPTEVLADQHGAIMSAWLAPLDVQMAVLTSSTPPKVRDSILESLARGEIHLLVGTHAILEPRVAFAKLGVMVVDEQHRFGVRQRLRLLAKASGDGKAAALHQLTMTATPIPRTLAMTMYADMEVSVIDEMPPGRLPVHTSKLPKSGRAALLERLRQRLAGGAKVFWVCTLVEESEAFDATDAQTLAEDLRGALPGVGVGLLHGRMKSAEKRQAMDDFRNGSVQLLVATTVVEVGVDVPDASIMVVEDPERLGLAQLHQLRGRVGRGGQQAYCLLFHADDIGVRALERLGVMCSTHSGFVIAEEDLRLRGMGELYGERQHGGSGFRVVDLQRDRHLVQSARAMGRELHRRDPAGEEVLLRRWLGGKDRYSAA